MLTSLPYTPTTGVPNHVERYLRDNGWQSSMNNGQTYWTTATQHGYFTWEQALAYAIFLKLHLGFPQ